jgi:hypothetical protein
VYVNIDDSKIIGKFKKEEAIAAINEYIETNQNKLLKPILNKRDVQGKKIHSFETALKQLHENLYEDYFEV